MMDGALRSSRRTGRKLCREARTENCAAVDVPGSKLPRPSMLFLPEFGICEKR